MASKDNTAKLQQDVKESARKIWLAGLGALATAEEQGTKVFQSLVERGEDFETRSEKQVTKVKGQVKDVTDKAETQWNRIEKVVDQRVTTVVQKLGIPSRKEVQTLTRRVEELTKKVEGLKPQAAKAEKPKAKAEKAKAKTKTKTRAKADRTTTTKTKTAKKATAKSSTRAV